MTPGFYPSVLLDHSGHVLIVFARGRTKYHAIEANDGIRLVALDTLRGLTPAQRNGEPYPVRKAASYCLHHSTQPMTARARKALRSLVARQP